MPSPSGRFGGERELRHVVRNRTATEARHEFLLGAFGVARRMKACDDLLRQQHLDVARVAALGGLALQAAISSLPRSDTRSYQRHINSSEIDITLPNISKGASVMPM